MNSNQPSTAPQVSQIIKQIPSPLEVRKAIAANEAERRLLNRLLKLSLETREFEEKAKKND